MREGKECVCGGGGGRVQWLGMVGCMHVLWVMVEVHTHVHVCAWRECKECGRVRKKRERSSAKKRFCPNVYTLLVCLRELHFTGNVIDLCL